MVGILRLIACVCLGLILCTCKSEIGGSGNFLSISEELHFIADSVSTDWPESFGFGRNATSREIDSLSIAIKPDGTGLPLGDGDVIRGEAIYRNKCVACHGVNGEGGLGGSLVSRDDIFGEGRSVRAIGNYWPYATTIFDYIRRAMPSNAPGSLTNEEVYSLTAWLLFQNGIIEENRVINAASLPKITMPAQTYFTPDNRTVGADPIY